MLYMTMHWTRFTQPGWSIYRCATNGCALAGGGTYIVLGSGANVSVIVETIQRQTSKCRLGPDAGADYPVDEHQKVTIALPTNTAASGETLDVWRSCYSWRYPADDDAYFVKLDPVLVTAEGTVTFTAERDCSYTLTTVRNVAKPPQPRGVAPSAAFPLPFRQNFDGETVGGEAPYFGDMMGKWETVQAGGGREGSAIQQQLARDTPWPILEPQCNDHSQPLSIIGGMYPQTQVDSQLQYRPAHHLQRRVWCWWRRRQQ